MERASISVRDLDAFARPQEEVRRKTALGGLVTLGSILVVLLLLGYELHANFSPRWASTLAIDTNRQDQMRINFDITFPKLPCFAMTLDLMDAAEQYRNNIQASKTRLSPSGEKLGIFTDKQVERPEGYCGNCHEAGSRTDDGKPLCCNSCSAVLAAYEIKKLPTPALEQIQQCREEDWAENIRNHSTEGCHIRGSVLANKVSGNLHFAPGHSHDAYGYHFHDVRLLRGLSLDFSHRIHHFSFGNQHESLKSPLDNTSNMPKEGHRCFKYYTKVVSTEFKARDGSNISTNQYAVTRNDLETGDERTVFPSVFFFYEISPMVVVYERSTKSFFSLLIGLCAIVGGVYTVASILDSFLHFADYHLRQKFALGKLN